MVHYKELADSAYVEYQHAINDYARFCDSNQESILESVNSKRDRLENAMQLKYTTYQTLVAQLENAKAKLQERTPAFTVIKSAKMPYQVVQVFLSSQQDRKGFSLYLECLSLSL